MAALQAPQEATPQQEVRFHVGVCEDNEVGIELSKSVQDLSDVSLANLMLRVPGAFDLRTDNQYFKARPGKIRDKKGEVIGLATAKELLAALKQVVANFLKPRGITLVEEEPKQALEKKVIEKNDGEGDEEKKLAEAKKPKPSCK